MENCSKRNNIVIWNIPEGAEKDKSCQELVNRILLEYMSLEEGIEVMRAHRTNIKRWENCTSGSRNFKNNVQFLHGAENKMQIFFCKNLIQLSTKRNNGKLNWAPPWSLLMGVLIQGVAIALSPDI